MSRYDVETLIRDTFRSHEAEADEGGADLAGAVRARVARRRRRATVAGAGAAAVAVLVAVGVVPALVGQDRARPPAGDTAAEDRAATADWRWESSLGAEIRVPAGWAVNDFGCGMTDGPSVVRGGGLAHTCLTPEAVHKELAIISDRVGRQPDDARLPGRSVTVSGVPALRAEGRLPDGRYAGTINVPRRDVAIAVRTRDAATTRRILDSLRLVQTDHVGCPTQRQPVVNAPLPGWEPPQSSTASDARTPPREPFVPEHPSAVSICAYGSGVGGMPRPERIRASTRLAGADATALAVALNAAPAGSNPAGKACPRPEPADGYDVLLLLRSRDGERRVVASWNRCVGRGLDNGVRRAQLTEPLLAAIMRPLGVGYVLAAPLSD
ncbi:hypothetical protein GA0070606_4228 [Micromonospora citrea]|uniref:Uncharacterized protein n=1 Tax=Micromonospora citrea TaxID=47855 RepID=A0A1C6VIB4_9ACTN|nr:hypothetical protein [Micromonospora citrea]SCL65957.1 hypothetical protein GA0070606_4228 [Micromonospora citrea]